MTGIFHGSMVVYYVELTTAQGADLERGECIDFLDGDRFGRGAGRGGVPAHLQLRAPVPAAIFLRYAGAGPAV